MNLKYICLPSGVSARSGPLRHVCLQSRDCVRSSVPVQAFGPRMLTPAFEHRIARRSLSVLNSPIIRCQAAAGSLARNMGPVLRQLFEKESSTYTYLLIDPDTNKAILIDPVLETVERDAQLVEELGLELDLAINTHCHADHITGTGKLKTRFPRLKSGISKAAGAKADVFYEDRDEIEVGGIKLTVRSTPGHTDGCVSYVLADLGGKTAVFTGDTLLIRGCGRTDFQQGSAERLYDSVHTQLFSLPDDTLVYPAHNYKGLSVSTIGEEKQFNPRLTKPKAEFVEIMANLNLPYPKKIDASLPANLVCGIED
eukprot:jgi/Ulvmu1/9312/UM050_0061.1